MEPNDLHLRNLTYRLVVDLGRAPTIAETAAAAGSTPVAVGEGWSRLHDAHALVLDPQTFEIRMATPFSALPTPHRVWANERWWFANCAWDAFGICAALHSDGRVETACPDCGELLAIDVQGERPSDASPVFHCLVPAARWWEDIGFT
jgi:Alkylmercury lyase